MKSILEKIENKISNKIGVISLILASLSLTTSILLMYGYFDQFGYIMVYFQYMNFNLMNLDIFEIRGATYTLNGLNIAFYFVFLISSIIYLFSKKNEKHLLQFSYAIIHYSAWIFLLVFLFRQFKTLTMINPLELILQIILLIFSYVILKATDKSLNFQQKITESEYIEASKYKRVIHLVIDTLLCIGLTFEFFFAVLPEKFLYGMTNLLGEILTAAILIIISSIIYYVIFEMLFKRTPGKYLTQTFVTGVKNELGARDIIIRSLSRKIPFNSFSFLGKKGWHDSISNSIVLSLNNNKRDHKYLLLIPAIGIFFFLNYKINDFRYNYKSYKIINGKLESEAKNIEYYVNNLKVGNIISLKNTDYFDTAKASYFFKVLKVNGESLTLEKIQRKSKHKTLAHVALLHEEIGFEQIDVDKNYLKKGICEKYNFFNGYKNCSYEYFDREQLRIYSIDNPLIPVINLGTFDRYHDTQNKLKLVNHGVDSLLTRIEVLEGDVKVIDDLPQKLNSYDNEFKINLEFNEKVGYFKLKLMFEDVFDKDLSTYIFESDGKFKQSLLKIEE